MMDELDEETATLVKRATELKEGYNAVMEHRQMSEFMVNPDDVPAVEVLLQALDLTASKLPRGESYSALVIAALALGMYLAEMGLTKVVSGRVLH